MGKSLESHRRSAHKDVGEWAHHEADAARSSGRVRGNLPGAAQGGRSMRRTDLRRGQALAVLMGVTALALIGAGSARKKRYEPPPPKVEETVSNIASIVSRAEIKVEGV